MRYDQNAVLKGYNMLLYFAGSMIMYEPDEECVNDFWTGGILKILPVDSRNPRFNEAASFLRNSCEDNKSCITILQNDYNRLLGTKILPLAPAVRSGYVDDLPGKISESVTDFYDSYGWKFKSRFIYPDDNLGVELLFLTLLIDKYISFDDRVCRDEMGSEIKRYINNHLLSWIPLWHERVQECADTLCYKGIASLIYACAEDIKSLLESSEKADEFPPLFRN